VAGTLVTSKVAESLTGNHDHFEEYFVPVAGSFADEAQMEGGFCSFSLSVTYLATLDGVL
jgi:hypothetical protein